MAIAIEVDTVLGVAYVRLSEEPVARSVEFNDDIVVDLDTLGVAVGVEVLDDGAELPFGDLVTRFHVRSEVVDLLRLIRPTIGSYLATTQGHDGTTISRPVGLVLSPA